MPAERLLIRVLDGLFSEKWLVLFVECVGDPLCADKTRVADGSVRMGFVKSGFRSGRF